MYNKDWDYIAHWQEITKTHYDDYIKAPPAFYSEQEHKLIEFIKSVRPEPRSIFEIGCGFGRIARALFSEPDFNIESYTGLDVASEQLKHWWEFVGGTVNDSLFVQLVELPIQQYTPIEKYDLVLSVGSLMGIPPHDIDLVYDKMLQLAEHHIINCEWYMDNPNLDWYGTSFVHQYRGKRIDLNIPDCADSTIFYLPIKQEDAN